MKSLLPLGVFGSIFLFPCLCFSQQIADPCFNSISPLGKFYNSDDIINLCGACFDNFQGANSIEWNGNEWLGQLPYSYIKRPPPQGCNVRALWLGYEGWTPGGEAIALRLDKPLRSAQTYTFTFTYAKDGRNKDDPDSLISFAPIIYTALSKPYYLSEALLVGQLPGTINWTTQSITFTASSKQEGHRWLILHGLKSSGSILSDVSLMRP